MTDHFYSSYVTPITDGVARRIKSNSEGSPFVIPLSTIQQVNDMSLEKRGAFIGLLCARSHACFSADGDMMSMQAWGAAFVWWYMYVNTQFVNKRQFDPNMAFRMIITRTMEDAHHIFVSAGIEPADRFAGTPRATYTGTLESMVPRGLFVCNTCGKPNQPASENRLWFCARCCMRAYCDKECQKADWRMVHHEYCGRQPAFWRREFMKGVLSDLCN